MDHFSLFNTYFLIFISPIFMAQYSSSSVSIRCSQTPYPQVCNHFINTNLLSTLDDHEQRFTFRDLTLKVTMDQAIGAHQLVSSLNLNSLKDERAKLAWNDCLELHEDTVDKINRSIGSNNALDANTWLSASIANQQTCQNGFTNLKIPNSYLQSFPNYVTLTTNLSKLLSNSLSLHKASTSPSALHFSKQVRGKRRLLLSESDDGFPEWVSFADRKLLQSTGGGPKADMVVAQDGSGNYETISEAVAAAQNLRSGSTERFVIHVKAGVYKENVEIKKTMKNIMFIGDGIDATIVTGNRNSQDGSTTYSSATFGVTGEGFIAQGMTFENTAGPQKHQAVALRSGADHSVFYRCSFKGYQDTLYVYSQRQFYRECDVYGTIDFICGDATAVLQNCNVYVRKPMSNQVNTVTAQSRTDANENTGIVIHGSRVTAAPDLRAVQGSFRTYLGRPWKKYSRTVIMKSDLDGLIDPAGWFPWSGSFALSTLYYGEYMNSGAGAATGGRVKWPGYRVITSAVEAGKFTVGNILAGESWIPDTGVPFSAGL
ncbi:PREDICTED: pectinesterase [Prunus dulcis]|uniref:Pectinesterase n=1 Tax=Prunus dulcis TaxID=3755 RepID=A0A5E4EG11_PRUDU|nr:pectinesterase [Prunus dulcis]VVA14564.1 PREDICTED: pectinesterase [Prunus dulcis]